tara:strand:+ start:193 stop:1314 length:1122 start_codon:yes stop_codon:yes gene_type:complete
MGVFNSTLRNVEVIEEIKEEVKEISIRQQITLEKDKIYNNRDIIVKNILNTYSECYCGCKYNSIFTKIKQKDINDDYTLIVEGNIDIIYYEVLQIEDDYCKNIRENLKKCENTYLHTLINKYERFDSFSKNPIHLSIINYDKIYIYNSDYKNLIIIKDSGIKQLPIVIHKKDEEKLRSKGVIGNVIQECLTAKKLVLERSVTTSHTKDTKKRKRRIEQIDILPMKKLNTTSYELDNFKYLENKYTYSYGSGCSCSCVNTITQEDANEAKLLVEGYRKKIIDKFLESLPCIYHIKKKQDKPELIDIIYNEKDNEKKENIDIYCGSTIIDYYTYIDDEKIPVVIKIKDENNLRKMGLIGNVIIDSKCSRLLLEKL